MLLENIYSTGFTYNCYLRSSFTIKNYSTDTELGLIILFCATVTANSKFDLIQLKNNSDILFKTFI
jgi:hypothetical protein